jgi:hypothetical protein
MTPPVEPNNRTPDGWTKGKFVRVCESLPPVDLEPVITDGADETGWTRGKPVRLCESLPPVDCVMAPPSSWPALVLRVTDSAPEAVVDVLLGALNSDWAAGGSGLTRDRTRETAEPGVVTLALVPTGPSGPDTEARLRELARRLTSPTVTATVIPAA